MNRVRHQIIDAGKHLLMALAPGYTGEGLRHNEQGKVPAAAGGACVADMLGAVIVYFERGRVRHRESRA